MRFRCAIATATAGLLVFASAAGAEVKTITDVAYAPPEPATSKGHLLDLYLPDGFGKKMPLLIWTQGSAWTSDAGKGGAPWQEFTDVGYAVAGVSIRSSSQVKFPGQLHDIKAAIRFLRRHATEYGLDQHRFAIMGNSSGGWTAAIAGTTGGIAELAGNVGSADPELYSDRVQAVVDLYGPTNFLTMNQSCVIGAGGPGAPPADPADTTPVCAGVIDHDSETSPESSLVGCAIQTCPDKVKKANPITYVSPDDPPFMIMHGWQDSLVPYDQSKQLFDALDKGCNDATFFTLPGHNHAHPYLDNPYAAPGRTVRETRGCSRRRTLTETSNPAAPRADWQTLIEFLDRAMPAR